MIALIGRVTLPQVVKLTIIYALFWNLNFAIIIRNSIKNDNYDPVYHDNYGGSYVYLFGCCFGGVFNFMLFRRQKLRVSYVKYGFNRISLAFAALGTAFIYVMFIFLNSTFM